MQVSSAAQAERQKVRTLQETFKGAMMSFDIRRTQLRAVISSVLGTAAFVAAVPPLHAQTLETITVTAQRRETDLQSTPVAISA